jgi:hypothetical protein
VDFLNKVGRRHFSLLVQSEIVQKGQRWMQVNEASQTVDTK